MPRPKKAGRREALRKLNDSIPSEVYADLTRFCRQLDRPRAIVLGELLRWLVPKLYIGELVQHGRRWNLWDKPGVISIGEPAHPGAVEVGDREGFCFGTLDAGVSSMGSYNQRSRISVEHVIARWNEQKRIAREKRKAATAAKFGVTLQEYDRLTENDRYYFRKLSFARRAA